MSTAVRVIEKRPVFQPRLQFFFREIDFTKKLILQFFQTEVLKILLFTQPTTTKNVKIDVRKSRSFDICYLSTTQVFILYKIHPTFLPILSSRNFFV